MLYFSFPFDLGVGLNFDGCGSNTLFLLCDFYLVLLLDHMCLNEVCLPSCVGNTIVFDPAHELGITTFLKLASALDGILIWVNFVCALALSFENVYVLLDMKEVALVCIWNQ